MESTPKTFLRWEGRSPKTNLLRFTFLNIHADGANVSVALRRRLTERNKIKKKNHIIAVRISSGSTPRSYTLPPGLYPPFIAPPPSTSITFSSFLLDCATIRELTQADLHTDTRTPVGRDRENSRSDRELRGVWSTRKRRRTVAARTQYRGYRGSS